MAMGVKCMNFKVAVKILKRHFHVIVILFHKTPKNKTMINFPDCVFQSVYYVGTLSQWYSGDLLQESTHLSCCCITIVFWMPATIWRLSWWTLGPSPDSHPVLRKISYKTTRNNSFLRIMQTYVAVQGRTRIWKRPCIVSPPQPKNQPRWGKTPPIWKGGTNTYINT